MMKVVQLLSLIVFELCLACAIAIIEDLEKDRKKRINVTEMANHPFITQTTKNDSNEMIDINLNENKSDETSQQIDERLIKHNELRRNNLIHFYYFVK